MPPQQRADARDELLQVEGFEQVVVRTGVEPGDAVRDGIAGGDDQDRQRVPGAPELRQQRKPVEARQTDRVKRVRAMRDQSAWRSALDAVGTAARGADNLVPVIVQAVSAHATVGEISDAMRAVFGEHSEIDV